MLRADCRNFTISSPIPTLSVSNFDGLGSRRDRFFAAWMFNELALSSSRLPRIPTYLHSGHTKVRRSKSGGSGVTRQSIIGTRHLGHGLPLISLAVAYDASMVPVRLRQISAAAQYCSLTATRCAPRPKKFPARKALGSHAGSRKLVVSVPCHANGTRMQSSDVAANCLVKIAHRAAAHRSVRRCRAIETRIF